MKGFERRQKLRDCLACGGPAVDPVRYEGFAPYCGPCGDEIAFVYGWEMLPDRREGQDGGPPLLPFASRMATRRPELAKELPPPPPLIRPEHGRRQWALPCSSCHRRFLPLRIFQNGHPYCEPCGLRLCESMGIDAKRERRTGGGERAQHWFPFEQPGGGFTRDAHEIS